MTNGLERFVHEQDPVYDEVIAELRQGEKQTHWMWFIFPQLRGLGESWMAHHFGIEDVSEAKDYLDHPTLGSRLRECTDLVCRIEGRSVTEIFDEIDAMKLRSSMTLFAAAASDPRAFQTVLDRFFGGNPDARTLTLIRGNGSPLPS